SYNNEYIRVSDSLQQEERRIRNKFNRIRFETDETLARNQQLAKQRMVWISIAGGVILLALALIIIIIQRIKNQRLKFQQQQQESNQEIFNLMLGQKQKVEEGKQSEQKRISEELHDGVLGEMNGIRMILLGLNKKADEAAIALREQAIEKLKQVQEEIRTISHELNDTSYQKLNNFMSSVEDLLKNICEPAGIK
ncbi:MAG: histidine kinase dimerization/phosphoacceptor domain-containing protein, partial [Muriicola sp.]